MEQQDNTVGSNDIDGVLPMDTGVTVNGVHEENGSKPALNNVGEKKGRGRPPKSAGSAKVNTIATKSDETKRTRGRPAKVVETTPAPKKVVVTKSKKEVEVPTNGDASKKKRGRPSKINTPDEQTNGISKPQVQQPIPVANHKEQENGVEPEKRKRGRPAAAAAPKKPAVVVVPKETSANKKRGRPAAVAKKPASKPKVPVTNGGSAKTRGRPKKAADAAPTPAIATTTNGQ